MKYVIALILTLSAHSALAAGAASWTCDSETPGLSASISASMFGEELTLLRPGRSEVFVRDTSAKLPPGEALYISERGGASASAEIVLEGPDVNKYEFGFQFQGHVFKCVRD